MADKDEQDEPDKEATENEDSQGGEGGEEGEEGEEGEGKKSKKMLFIIIGAVVLLLGGGGAAAYFTGMLDGLLGKEAPAEEAEDGKHGDPHDKQDTGHAAEEDPYDEDGYGEDSDGSHGAPADHGEDSGDDAHAAPADDGHGGDAAAGGKFVPIPTMLINLNTDNGTPRYLRLTVQIELKSESDYGAVEKVIPKVVDQFQTYLRELRVKDLRGSAGIYRLQMELLWRVNQAVRPIKVKDVLFQEILIQ